MAGVNDDGWVQVDDEAATRSDGSSRRVRGLLAIGAMFVVLLAGGIAFKPTIARHLRRSINHEPGQATSADTTVGGAPTSVLPTERGTAPRGDTFPTPATTGVPADVALVPYRGPDVIGTEGTILDRQDIATCLTVRPRRVTITRSRVRCSGDFGIRQDEGAEGLVVEDVEITSGAGMVDRAIRFTNGATLRRAYVHDTQRGIAVGSNTLIESSYVGTNRNGTDAHSSVVMTSGGTRHVIVRNNTLQTVPDTNATSAISFIPSLPPAARTTTS